MTYVSLYNFRYNMNDKSMRVSDNLVLLGEHETEVRKNDNWGINVQASQNLAQILNLQRA